MYVDSHVHLQPHGHKPPVTRERIEQYLEVARRRGVEQVAFTEHLFRFEEAYRLLYGWWDADRAHPQLCATAAAYWRDHVSLSVAEYVGVIEDAKSAGLPVLLGLEMDWLPGRGDELRRFLAPCDWDIVLGSVHWIGSWGFDSTQSEVDRAQWEQRDIDAVHSDYAALLRELASAGLCDVLAHSDLPKLLGHRPKSFTPLHSAIVEAAQIGSCAIEMNSHGLNKACAEQYPATPVLERARGAGLAITLASDAHDPERVGERFDDLADLAASAGYQEFVSFEGRRAVSHALPVRAKE
jgi:histidinol-phosphatase (PHP family)